MSKGLLLIIALLASAATTAIAAKPRDRDHDRLPDRWEKHHHLSTFKKSAKKDPDHDRLRNLREYRLRTNPRKKDTDGDGFSDRREVRAGTNPRKRKSHPRTNPSPSAAPSGFPNASNTGVPAGTNLTAGPSTISTPGAVVEGKTMGCVRVTAPGVVIRKSKISCAGDYAVYVKDGDYSGTPLLIEDSEIDCQTTNGTGVGEANVTVRRVEITRCENGADINQNFVVEDSFIHDLASVGSDPHEDGIQLAWGRVENGRIVDGAQDVTIRHNTIYGINVGGSFGTSAIISNGGNAGNGPDENILIEKNLLAGGANTLYCDQGGKQGINYRVLNNAFTTQFKSTVGFYAVSSDCSDEVQSGNYYYESGNAIRLP
jgi:hypothetical protein